MGKESEGDRDGWIEDVETRCKMGPMTEEHDGDDPMPTNTGGSTTREHPPTPPCTNISSGYPRLTSSWVDC